MYLPTIDNQSGETNGLPENSRRFDVAKRKWRNIYSTTMKYKVPICEIIEKKVKTEEQDWCKCSRKYQ